jgi:hypothetical protein
MGAGTPTSSSAGRAGSVLLTLAAGQFLMTLGLFAAGRARIARSVPRPRRTQR